MSMRKIGVLTSGGDSPGMNAAVMSVARSAALYGIPLIGVKRGYNGLLRKSSNLKDDLQELTMELVLDIADEPGTYLRTARCLEFKEKKVQEKAIKTLLKAAKTADNASLTPTFLIQAGELYEAEGKPEKALELYMEIKNEYVNSMAYQEIDKYIERVK